MYEVNKKNYSKISRGLKERGYKLLEKDISNILKINEENYNEETEFGTDKGYGIRIFLLHDRKEMRKIDSINSLDLTPEYSTSIVESNGFKIQCDFYLVGSENGIIIYCV